MEKSKNKVNSIKNTKTYSIVLIAFFTALTAVFSQIVIPIGPVPINLSLLAVFIAGGLLGISKSVISQVVYLLLGAVGIPVFAGFSGGIGILIGPTGGYIIGYVFTALVVSLILHKFNKKIYHISLSLVVGLLVCYILGTLWFTIVTSTPFIDALFICVIPFIIGDVLKIIVATTLIHKLKKIV